jgi:hypothetical protein
MDYRTLWDGVSVALILRFYPEGVDTKRGNGAQGMVSAICKACGKEMKARGGGPIEYFPFCLLRRSDGRAYADARAARTLTACELFARRLPVFALR